MFATETCARKKPEVLPENRVGDFFSISITRTGQNQPEPLEPHRETSTMDTTTVSGVVYWLSKDPIGISGGLNLYAFCGTNPVNFIDPFGLDFTDWVAEKCGFNDWKDDLQDAVQENYDNKNDPNKGRDSQENVDKITKGMATAVKKGLEVPGTSAALLMPGEGAGKVWDYIKDFLKGLVKDKCEE